MTPRNPAPTVHVIITLVDRPHQPIVLIERKHPPYGWALPGGFVDYGESLESAARREAKEETGLDILLVNLFHAYSKPDRDEHQHTISVVFLAETTGEPHARNDAKGVGAFFLWALPQPLCFDHGQILRDYYRFLLYGLRPTLI
ncbi:MAG: NUDIX domain-containing protein [Pseudanabaenaceae cyanobacterium]